MEEKIGYSYFPLILFLAFIFLVIFLFFFYQLYLSIKEDLHNKPRFINVMMVGLLLLLIAVRPTGIINFEKFEGKDLFIAERESDANCNTTFKLKEHNKFIETSFCFGKTRVEGDYTTSGDTLFFHNVEQSENQKSYYQFAVIKNKDLKEGKFKGDLIRFKDNKDTTPVELWIIKNEL